MKTRSHPFFTVAARVSPACRSDVDVGSSASPDPLATSSEAPPAAVLARLSMLMTIVVAVVIVAALYFGREVLIPITIALLLTFLLSPLVELLRHLRLGRIPLVVLAVVVALAIIVGIAGAIGTQVAQLAQDIPDYQATIEKKIAAVRDTTLAPLNKWIDSISHQLSGPPPNQSAPQPAPASPSDTPQEAAPQPVPVVVTQPQASAMEIGKQVISPLINPLATTGIIFVVTIFALLAEGGSSRSRYPASRIARSTALDARLGRCRAQAQPLFSDPARP